MRFLKTFENLLEDVKKLKIVEECSYCHEAYVKRDCKKCSNNIKIDYSITPQDFEQLIVKYTEDNICCESCEFYNEEKDICWSKGYKIKKGWCLDYERIE